MEQEESKLYHRRREAAPFLDEFSGYVDAAETLLSKIDNSSIEYIDIQLLVARLQENIAQTRLYGSSTDSDVERYKILSTLNELSLDAIGVTFSDLFPMSSPTEEHNDEFTVLVATLQDLGVKLQSSASLLAFTTFQLRLKDIIHRMRTLSKEKEIILANLDALSLEALGISFNEAYKTRSRVSVFISHSSKDNEWCEVFARELSTRGYDIWYDSSNLKGGSEWMKIIESEIEQRGIFIIILTPDAWGSNWVTEELTLAMRKKKIIIPIELKTTALTGFILNRQIINAVGVEILNVVAKVLDSLPALT